MPTLGEFDLITAIAEQLGGRRELPPGVAVGSGDDAAALSGGRYRLLTVDTMVAGTHWDPRLSTPADVGFKLLASNLSDIAAMGGWPGPFLLALTLPRPLDADWALALAAGIADARQAHGLDPAEVVPIGGDLTSTDGPAVLTLVLLGRELRRGKRLLRSGARPGDGVWVSGPLGGAAAGLAALQAGLDPARHADLVARHRRPRARLDLVPGLVALPDVHACIDLSDGLAGDLPHVLKASGVGAEVDLPAVPVPPELEDVAARVGAAPLDWVLGGGEDYELLLTGAPRAASQLERLGFSAIGRIVASTGLRWLDQSGRELPISMTGYRHA